jgi:anthranilate synthase/aminodeoxychorismate synthase-like glutamine amidotransferase
LIFFQPERLATRYEVSAIGHQPSAISYQLSAISYQLSAGFTGILQGEITMILVIDNYDSFTYNLVQYLRQLEAEVRVVRNDATDIQEIAQLQPAGIVLSPGPGRPASAGICLSVIRHFSGIIPILGVCLGHQSIAEAFGGKIVHARRLMHGKTSLVTADEQGLFSGINKPFKAMRYHSLAVSGDSLPECLLVTAVSEDNEIMGIRHERHCTEGIQFHPESIMTTVGKRLLRNFLKQVDTRQKLKSAMTGKPATDSEITDAHSARPVRLNRFNPHHRLINAPV